MMITFLFSTLPQVFLSFDTYFILWYYIYKRPSAEHLVSTIGLDGLFPLSHLERKTHLRRVTFGWVLLFLLLLLMYVKRARMNDPNKNIIVNASFTSMASPLSKGNHAHPRFNCSYILPFIESTHKRSYSLSFLDISR